MAITRILARRGSSPAPTMVGPSWETSWSAPGRLGMCWNKLLDHLVGSGQQRLGDGEAKGFSGLEVDDELEPPRPRHRQIAGLLAAENAAGIVAELPILLRDVGPVAHQSAGFGKVTLEIERRHPMLRGQRYDLHPMAGKKAAGTDKQDLGPLFHKARKSRVDVADVAGIEDLDSPPNWDGRSSHIW